MFSRLKWIVPALFLVGCTGNEHEAKELEEPIDVKGRADGKQIGLNEDDEVIIQSETSAADELRTQTWVNNQLESDIDREHEELKRCRRDLSDPRLGGSGNLVKIPDVDDMKPASEVKEKFGLDKQGNLKFVKKEYYLDRLKKERQYEKSLKKMRKLLVQHNEDCSSKMARARLSHGLPAKRYEAKGYFTQDGTWVSTYPAERTLDDAFERAAKARAKSDQ